MTEKQDKKDGKVLSRTGLVLGAAGLFLFIVGLKRKYHLDDEHAVEEQAPPKRKKRSAEQP